MDGESTSPALLQPEPKRGVASLKSVECFGLFKSDTLPGDEGVFDVLLKVKSVEDGRIAEASHQRYGSGEDSAMANGSHADLAGLRLVDPVGCV